LCEGETEVAYFKSYIVHNNQGRRFKAVRVEVIKPKKFTPFALFEEAKKRMNAEKGRKGLPYESVWIVFDKDQHPDIPKTFKEAHKADINIAFSVMCFEYWVLLHFEHTARAFQNCAEIVSRIKNKHYPNYQKANENFFNKVKDNVASAISRAEKVMQNYQDQLMLAKKNGI